MELAPGGTLGRYRLLDRAGAGGMAEVWRAIQPRLERIVAIKVLPRHLANVPGYLERFEREARAISRLEHPNILGIYDYGEDDGYTYMVMPFLSGGTLSRNMGQPWTVQAAVRVLEPLASALDYAHARGTIHRDVKPSNVLIGEDGRIVLADFGIARITEGSLMLSASGALIGTPAYMAPEQVQGIPVTHASDQYALGIMAYEMLTGRRPFNAEAPLAVALAHVHRPLPPPRTFNPYVTTDEERVLFKALAKQPEDRYPSVSAFVGALSEADRQLAPPPRTNDIAPRLTVTSSTRPPRMAPVPQMPQSVQSGQRDGSASGPSRTRHGPVLAAGGMLLIAGVFGWNLLGALPFFGGTAIRSTPSTTVEAAVSAPGITNPTMEVARPATATLPSPAGMASAPLTPSLSSPKPATGSPNALQTASVPRVHVVEAGDTWNRIAQRYGVTVEAMMQANGFTDRNRILRIGERVIIPN